MVSEVMGVLFFVFKLFVRLLVKRFSSRYFEFVLLGRLRRIGCVFLNFKSYFVIGLAAFSAFKHRRTGYGGIFLFRCAGDLFQLLCNGATEDVWGAIRHFFAFFRNERVRCNYLNGSWENEVELI